MRFPFASVEIAQRLAARDCGATVATAQSSEQALNYSQITTFDVLLCDLGMAGINGFDLIKKNIRHILGMSKLELPAAALSAFVRPEDLQGALNEGFQICIRKPVSVTTLAHTVSERMHIRGAAGVGAAATEKQATAALDISVSKPQGEQLPESSDMRLRALFVEDNVELQEQIEWLLAEEGLDVVTCVSAEAAMHALSQGEFDVIITDVSLPKMSGVEFARWALASAPNRWLIFSTGYPMGDKLEQFGPNVRALLKPFEAQELHQLMAAVRSDHYRKRGA